ncbi:MAG: NADP-dependent oxidoreductase [Solirubrobacteraceae bacterium]
MRAVRFERYGGIDVLDVVDVQPPAAGRGELLVRVKDAGINPGEAKIREGLLHERWPATFPSGQGSDLAGIVEQVGDGVDGWAAGDEVIGFTHNRASQAELVVVEAENVTTRPAGVPWPVAGSLFVAGTTAYATVRAVSAASGDTVVVAGAAGGVGSIAVQLAVLAGATVIGLAGEHNHAWLRDLGTVPIAYGDGVGQRIRDAADGAVDAFIDLVGSDYVQLALDLGVRPERVDTIVDFGAGQKYGVKTEGTAAAANAGVLAELAALIDEGRLDVPIARVYPLEQVREAFRELEQGHTRGKIVLEP